MKLLRALFALAVFFTLSASYVRAQQTSPPAPPVGPPASIPLPDASGAPPQQSQSSAPPDEKQQDQKQQAPTIVVPTTMVRLVATVMDRHHGFVTDLNQKDFKVVEDGQPQDIRYFTRETDLPLRIGLLLDTSNSIRPRLQFEQDAAIDFLTSVVRRNKDMAFLMTFDNEPEVIQDFTGDLSYLVDAIHKQRAGGGTALNDAIFMASQKLANAPLPKGASQDIRRVLVVISDGDDNLSDHAISEALESAIRAEVSIYSVSTNTDWLAVDDETKPQKYHLDPGDKVLQQFADESGGRVFYPYKIDDLAQSFLDIGIELRSQYFIAYAPTNAVMNGAYRRVEVDTDHKGLIVRTRKGYYANASGSTQAPVTK